jgi:DNA-binding transcriptional ArsR family regulator
MRPTAPDANALTATFTALADPTRRAILARLSQGDANVSELSAPFAVSQPAISKHLRVLEAAGLISQRRVATATINSLEARPLREAMVWMQTYQEFWERSYDRLDELVQRMAQDDAGPRISATPPVGRPDTDTPATNTPATNMTATDAPATNTTATNATATDANATNTTATNTTATNDTF